ncbi:MAG: hypothetical protein PHQ72_02635 [Hespellia sp.]|nr:hypothetical protein [Hespellia sp.]
MNESTKKIIKIIIYLIIFAVSVLLVIAGQRDIGVKGLGMQLIGIAGLILLLWNYNRQFK